MPAIGNPTAAQGADTLDRAAEGMRTIWFIKTDGAVTAGDPVCWTGQATDIVPLVHSSDLDTDDPASVAGVALESAASGDILKVCRQGPCKVNIGSGTVAAWERAIITTTVGVADGDAHDASDIVGDDFGVFLGAEIGTTNQAVVDVRCG